MKHKRRLSWMLSLCMLILTIMISGIDVQAVEFNQESVQATNDSGLEKTENEATKEREDITDEFTNLGESNTEELEVREDETITSMDEEGNVSEAPEESGLLEIDLLSNDGKIVNFNTKGAVVTTYTEVGTGNAGYTCGAYGADAAYLGTENGKVKFLLSGVTGLVDAKDVQIVSVDSAASVSYYVVSSGRLIHNITTNITQGNYITSLDNGPAPLYLSEGTQYYSYDGHYFYTRDRFSNMLDDYKAGVRTNSINSSSPYYNYYQYLPLRSKTAYSAAQLNKIINSKAAGYKMCNTGDVFTNYQNTYGVNALIAVGIAANESAWGQSSIAQKKNNLFGLNAVDAAPGQSANAYESIDACIKTFTETYMSKRYLNPKNWVYSGGYLGNKGSGMNVRYASDPYWGEKNANVAWMIDKTYGNKDSNRYTIGIKDVIGNEHTELNVRIEASVSSIVIHTTKDYSNQAFIILDSSQGNFYKVQSDAALTTNRKKVSEIGEYNFNNMYSYVSSDFVKIVLQRSENSIESEVKCNIPEGVYTIGSALDNSKILSVEESSIENHKNIVLEKDSNINGYKQFEIKRVENDWYRIEVGGTGKVLEIPNSSADQEVLIQQNLWNGTNGQLWCFIDAGDGCYYIKSKVGTYLDLKVANTTEGNYIQTNILNKNNAQRWKLNTTTYGRTIEDGTYIISTIRDNKKVLDLYAGSLSDRGNIQIYTLNGSAAQKYEITYVGKGYYKIIVEKSGKALDVSGGSKESGVNLQQYEWNGTDAQLWRFIDAGNGQYYIKSKLGTVLDVYTGQTTNGTNVWQYELNETDAQKWGLKSVEEYPVQAGIYSIRSAMNTEKILDIWAASMSDGANVQLFTSNGTDAQKFKLSYAGKGFYEIISIKSGKVLDVYAASMSNGANVQQYTSNNSDAQLWKIVDVGNGYYYIRSKLGKMLDVYAASTADGSNVQLYTANGSAAQKWKIKPMEEGVSAQQVIEDGTYVISSCINTDKVLDLYAGSLSNGANIQIHTFNNTLAQKYKITYVKNGFYKIIIAKSGKVLDVYAASLKSETNVQQYEWNGTDAQLWKFVDAGNGYYYIQSKLGTVIDLQGGQTANGTNVWMYSLNKTKAQKWKLKKQ